MAAQTFGKTWWGSEWLKSLTHIDYANRIPREVFQVAKRIGLTLFPQRWDDLDMHCSCPD